MNACYETLNRVIDATNTIQCNLSNIRCKKGQFMDKDFKCHGGDKNVPITLTDSTFIDSCEKKITVNGKETCEYVQTDKQKFKSCCDIPRQYKNAQLKIGDEQKNIQDLCRPKQLGLNAFVPHKI